jgi:hypothetical protein
MDFSVYLVFINQLDVPLTDPSYSASHGSWADKPTAVGAQSSSTRFRLKDSLGFYGAEGALSFSVGAFGTLNLKFGCPFSSDNYFSVSDSPLSLKVTWVGSNNDQSPQYGFPKKGHPLYIWVTISPTSSQNVFLEYLKVSGPAPAIGLPNIKGITTQLSGALWKPGMITSDGQGGSLYPVAFTGTASFTASVAIASVVNLIITVCDKNGNVILKGYWSQGNGSVIFAMVRQPAGFYSCNQLLFWKAANAHSPSQPININVADTSFTLEWYGLFNAPVQAVFPNRGYIQVYRALALAMGQTDYKEEMVSRVVNYCLLNPGTLPTQSKNIYDRGRGASHYAAGSNGGSSFRVLEYIDTGLPRHLCNCYDQAAGVQALLAIVGISTQWYYMNPFGFINTTSLVGWGPCNNPFDANSGYLVLDENDPKRTAFGNHGFCTYAGYVLDATSAGHNGIETLPVYVKNAVDSITQLYKNPPYMGTVANAKKQTGLTNIDAVATGSRYQPLAALQQHAHVQELQTMGLTIGPATGGATQYVVLNWNYLETLPVNSGLPYGFVKQFTTVGIGEVERVYHFVKGEEIISIVVSVHTEEETALRKLMTTAVETQTPYNPFVVHALGNGGLRSTTGGFVEWWFANCWIRITSTRPDVDVMAIAGHIQQQMQQHLQPTPPRPSLTVTPDQMQVQVGDEVEVAWQVKADTIIEVGTEGDGLTFWHRMVNSVNYWGNQPSSNSIIVVAADNQTLFMNTASVLVHVEE